MLLVLLRILPPHQWLSLCVCCKKSEYVTSGSVYSLLLDHLVMSCFCWRNMVTLNMKRIRSEKMLLKGCCEGTVRWLTIRHTRGLTWNCSESWVIAEIVSRRSDDTSDEVCLCCRRWLARHTVLQQLQLLVVTKRVRSVRSVTRERQRGRANWDQTLLWVEFYRFSLHAYTVTV